MWPWDVRRRFDQIDAALAEIQRRLDARAKGDQTMAATLADLKAAVEDERTINRGAITLLTQLTAMIQANKTDPVAIQAILDEVNASKSELAAAITTNTPAEAAPQA